MEAQKAMGCINPGIFGCKDRGEVSEEAKDTSVLRPASGRVPPVRHDHKSDRSAYDRFPELEVEHDGTKKVTDKVRVISLGSYNVAIPGGWRHRTEVESNQRVITSIYHPNGIGTLKFTLLTSPIVVTREILRNMTNVDLSITLTWQDWGDYSGYQYNYFESGVFYKQWWLVNGGAILFITYSCDPELKDIETEEINTMINSITVNKP